MGGQTLKGRILIVVECLYDGGYVFKGEVQCGNSEHAAPEQLDCIKSRKNYTFDFRTIDVRIYPIVPRDMPHRGSLCNIKAQMNKTNNTMIYEIIE